MVPFTDERLSTACESLRELLNSMASPEPPPVEATRQNVYNKIIDVTRGLKETSSEEQDKERKWTPVDHFLVSVHIL